MPAIQATRVAEKLLKELVYYGPENARESSLPAIQPSPEGTRMLAAKPETEREVGEIADLIRQAQ